MPSEQMSDATVNHPMYCVKCRTMVTITAPKKVVMKSSRHALQGNCPHCNTSTYKIIAKTE
jgi:Zn finger protein HypA/HybF involved in hydrogenase expression